MGVFGVYIHNLRNGDGEQSSKGTNPFERFDFVNAVKTYDPPFSDSKDVYRHIRENLDDWAEESIKIRSSYP